MSTQVALERLPSQQGDASISCSVGIMAYNEESNITHAIEALLNQSCPSVCLQEIIVVASGCTDRTVPIVTEIAHREPRVRLYVQERREGKASAINLFLKLAVGLIVVLIGADVIPETSALEYLCAPFKDPKVGMVGGRPVPVNDPTTFMGYAVHLLWRLHDGLARIHPKLGEVIAFRNVISGIPINSAVDEISIQALISQLGYHLIYQPACIIYNKGPHTLREFLRQRRRIYAGHMQTQVQQNFEAPTMRVGPIARQLLASHDFTLSSPKKCLWTAGVVMLEAIARLQGSYDFYRKREHHIWQMVESTKQLEAGYRTMRRVSKTQSVLIFRLLLENAPDFDLYPERADRELHEVARKLLPVLRASLRKEDTISISGPGIMTAVIRAEEHGAELVAKHVQEIVQATPVRIGMIGRKVSVTVTSTSLTFTLQAEQRARSSEKCYPHY